MPDEDLTPSRVKPDPELTRESPLFVPPFHQQAASAGEPSSSAPALAPAPGYIPPQPTVPQPEPANRWMADVELLLQQSRDLMTPNIPQKHVSFAVPHVTETYSEPQAAVERPSFGSAAVEPEVRFPERTGGESRVDDEERRRIDAELATLRAAVERAEAESDGAVPERPAAMNRAGGKSYDQSQSQGQSPIVKLNNAAQAKSYRQFIDVYQKQGTNQWFGTVYLGRESRAIYKPEYSADKARSKLVDLGLEMLKKMPRGDPRMLEYFPKPPHKPPSGHVRDEQGAAKARAAIASPSGIHLQDKEHKRAQTSRAANLLTKFEAMNVQLNFVSLLNEWAMLGPPARKNPHYQATRESESCTRHDLSVYVSGYDNANDHTFTARAYGENAPNASKRMVAEKAVTYLLDKGLIEHIDPDGHIRRHGKRPSQDPPADFPAAKKVQTLAPSNAPTGPRNGGGFDTPTRSPVDIPAYGQATLLSRSGSPTASSQASTPVSNPVTAQIPVLAPTPTPAAAAPASIAEVATALQTEQSGEKQSRVDACALLTSVLGYGEPVYYWIPSDPVYAPNAAFDCSAHLTGFAPNGVMGGAVLQLKNHRVESGAEIKEVVATALYQWLDAQREEKRRLLQEQIKQLGL